MDAIDQAIIDRLRVDGRAPYGAIAEEVGLSASAVKRRVDRLVDEGIIQGFTVRVGPPKDSTEVRAYVELFCTGTVAPATLSDILERVPEVRNAGTVSGQADAIVHMIAPTITRLERAIEQIREAPNIDHTVTSIVLTPILDRP